jgi:hypothetical protein
MPHNSAGHTANGIALNPAAPFYQVNAFAYTEMVSLKKIKVWLSISQQTFCIRLMQVSRILQNAFRICVQFSFEELLKKTNHTRPVPFNQDIAKANEVDIAYPFLYR